MKKVTPMPTSRFIKVKCTECGSEQIIFNKASTVVKCLICENILAEPTGGKARIKARILQVLE